MNVYHLIAGIVVLALLIGGLRWQFDYTMDKVQNPDESNLFPVTTPFTSKLCGPQNRDCKSLDLDDLNPTFDP